MYYLIDTESGNLVGGYPSQDDALHAVRYQLDAGGMDEVGAWALERQDDSASHDAVVIAQGAELITLAELQPA
jgi:hypothetical protein